MARVAGKMGKTIAEKILSNHSQTDAYANDIVIADVDHVMAHDGNGPLAIEMFRKMGGEKVFDPQKVKFVCDHYAPSPNESVSRIHHILREFTKETGAILFEVGDGVCHQVMPERGNIKPGELIAGSDSHTVTYGALNAFGTGIGSTDTAAAMLTGKLWFKVPETIAVKITGEAKAGVYPKDVILYLVSQITADGATYQAIEFKGDYVQNMEMDGRFTFANMVVEMGAKAGLFEFDEKTKFWLEDHGVVIDKEPVFADPDASYVRIVEVDASRLVPMVAKPHTVDNVAPVTEVEGIPVNQAFIGTCTNGRLSDLMIARDILKGKKISKNTRMIIAPASRRIYMEAARNGVLADLVEAGALVVTPGCGCCVGACNGIPGDGEKVISTANRNFKGRMGNSKAEIYLASPATVAVSALYGKITDPRTLL